jgi:hypothetical protein
VQPLWSSKEYAAATGRSERTVERERERGDGCPYLRLGRLIFYRPEDVENYIAANLRGANSPPAVPQDDPLGRDREQDLVADKPSICARNSGQLAAASKNDAEAQPRRSGRPRKTAHGAGAQAI